MRAEPPPGALSREELLRLYREELGSEFDPADLDRLLSVHREIEAFFAAAGTDERNARAGAIARSGVSAARIGRICRIRLGWPELPGGVYYVNERVGPHAVVYFLGVPKDYTRTRAWPLVVRFPPADPFVAEPRPDQPAIARLFTGWIEDELTRHPDALVLMPVLNFDHLFGPGYAGMNAVMQPILHASGRANVDPARVYLVGHSMGAHAAWNLALHHPTYFAAFNAMAGSARGEFQRLRLRNLLNTWPVVWHDTADEIVKVDVSRQLVRALRGLKVNVDYEETRDLGHAPPAALVERMYAKLRSRVRPLYPATVALQSNRMDPPFNRVDWLQIDQPSRPGDDRRMFLTRGTERFVVQANAWSARGTIRPPNRIELTAENVELLRVFLNDRMLDLTRPIAVSVNGRVRFEGTVRPDIEAMLNDQLFLGRGWRCFTGVIELDLAARSAPSTRPATTRPATTRPVGAPPR